ncbi:hypothetical protein RA28_05875 [Ruegeria sp. ANG-S4]|nr:hypothetical protein RA28_05875 [Ruegeria sp. ANG-S4]
MAVSVALHSAINSGSAVDNPEIAKWCFERLVWARLIPRQSQKKLSFLLHVAQKWGKLFINIGRTRPFMLDQSRVIDGRFGLESSSILGA